jgi:hypothetical protein
VKIFQRGGNFMSGIMVDCPTCRGAGKILHECNPWDCIVIEFLYQKSGAGWSESLSICKCQICGQLYKVRNQWDAGTGSDDIWIMPGETERGYSFPLEEAAKYAGEPVQPTLFSKEEIEKCQIRE